MQMQGDGYMYVWLRWEAMKPRRKKENDEQGTNLAFINPECQMAYAQIAKCRVSRTRLTVGDSSNSQLPPHGEVEGAKAEAKSPD